MVLNKLKNILNQDSNNYLNKMDKEIAQIRINQGKAFSDFNLLFKQEQILKDISKAEFQVFSQWGDDGIINFLVNYLEIKEKTFIEFGVENYTECNTRFLLINDNWSGLIIDGSKENIDSVKKENIYWKYDLKAIASFVTAENIDQIITDNGIAGQIGILHIDIDGNDYWVWKSIKTVDPIIVIVEYNSIFGYENPWTIPYDAAFVRGEKHYSNLYYGTSLLSLCDLAQAKGYSFIGCNSNGNNAYFVKNDQLNKLRTYTSKEGYVQSKFAESRDQKGKLTYLRNEKRISLLKGLPVFNTRTNNVEFL
ncbi:MAG: hypothetical protein ACJ748_10765 [Flavisolibacter sp.]